MAKRRNRKPTPVPMRVTSQHGQTPRSAQILSDFGNKLAAKDAENIKASKLSKKPRKKK